jgi:mycothiol synthase
VSIELRPPSRDDAAGIVQVTRQFGFRDETVRDVHAWFDVPSNDLERDGRVALVDGSIVGYGDISDSSREGKILWADVRAQPAAATALLDFVEDRARQLAAEGGKIKIWSPEGNPEWRSLLERRGYELDHYSFRMWIDLGDELPEPAWPDGISIRAYERDRDEQAVYEAHQETFSDQRDFSPDPFDDWRQWAYREPFDPELWLLAVAEDELAGIALCRPERGGDDSVAWINVVGVRRPWRRKGVGLALLQQAFREFRAREKQRVGLGVDGDNPTGAVRLYERAGMKPEEVYVWYERPV